MLLSQNAHMTRTSECLSENIKAAGCRCGLDVSTVHSRVRGEETTHEGCPVDDTDMSHSLRNTFTLRSLNAVMWRCVSS